jgi:prophage regulatory protein
VNQTTPTKATFNFDDLSDDALLRLKDLRDLKIIPFSSTTVWRKTKDRTFPGPKKLSPNIVAWRCGDIRDWLKNPSNYKAVPESVNRSLNRYSREVKKETKSEK